MPVQAADANVEIVSRYTDQPARLPADLREKIEDSWGGKPVQIYAVADLDESLRLARTWVALGPEHIALVSEEDGRGPAAIRQVERARIRAVREAPGLSCTRLMLLGSSDEPALAVLRYTHRQRRAMENIKYILEQKIQGQDLTPTEEPDKVYAGSVAQPIKEAQALVTPNKLAVLWRLLAYLKPYRARVVWGTIPAVLMTVASLIPPKLTGYFLDNVVKPFESGKLTHGKAMAMAWTIIACIAAISVIREVCLWLRLRMMTVLGEYVARDLRRDLYEHLQDLSLSYYSKRQTGSIMSRVTHDTDRLWDFLAFGVVDFGLSFITLIGLGVVLISIDRPLGIMMSVSLPIFFWSISSHFQYMRRFFLRAWRKWSNLTDVLSDTIPGMQVVKAFSQEEYEKRRFAVRNADCFAEFSGIHATWTKFWPMLMMGIHTVMLLVWIFALPRLLGRQPGAATLTSGQFVSFLLYMGMFFMPIEGIGQMSRMINRATSSAHRIFEVLDTEPEVTNIPEPVRLTPVEGRVTFDRVFFSYDGVRQIIKGISFDVEQGEMIGLVGPSGAGKTTIINLIARFFDVTGGRILIDGADLRRLDMAHYRRQIGMVQQDPHLFHGTIIENIRYGRPDASIDEAVAAAKAANAHDFVCKLAHGYDTIVGERGHTLSGGERQRVSIARAVLNDPRILILDEATSSVDTETERKIQEALERLIAGRTVFAIAHRLSTLRQATRLLVIEEGKIAEQGTHAELLAKEDGAYAKLYRMQRELHEMYAL